MIIVTENILFILLTKKIVYFRVHALISQKFFQKPSQKYVALPVSERSKRYLSQYIQIEDNITLAIGKHAMRYMLHGDICAYYKDMEDFFSDWCSIGYTRTEARKLLHSGHGEFMKLPDNLGYIRFAI